MYSREPKTRGVYRANILNWSFLNGMMVHAGLTYACLGLKPPRTSLFSAPSPFQICRGSCRHFIIIPWHILARIFIWKLPWNSII